MALQYLTPLEHRLDAIIQNPNNHSLFMVSSSGIPVLYALANSEREVTAVDLDKSQILLLQFLVCSLENISHKDFLKLVNGENIANNELTSIVNSITKRFEIFKSDDINQLITDYQVMARQNHESAIAGWYQWLNPEIYERLKHQLKAGKLTILYGEFTSALQFELDEHYDFIDMSNIREWKYQASTQGFRFLSEWNYELYMHNFESWDMRTCEIIYEKAKQDAVLRNKTFPEFWKRNPITIEDCDYWRSKFTLIKKDEQHIMIDNNREKVISSFYQKI